MASKQQATLQLYESVRDGNAVVAFLRARSPQEVRPRRGEAAGVRDASRTATPPSGTRAPKPRNRLHLPWRSLPVPRMTRPEIPLRVDAGWRGVLVHAPLFRFKEKEMHRPLPAWNSTLPMGHAACPTVLATLPWGESHAPVYSSRSPWGMRHAPLYLRHSPRGMSQSPVYLSQSPWGMSQSLLYLPRSPWGTFPAPLYL
jgi:hypothetical protein